MRRARWTTALAPIFLALLNPAAALAADGGPTADARAAGAPTDAAIAPPASQPASRPATAIKPTPLPPASAPADWAPRRLAELAEQTKQAGVLADALDQLGAEQPDPGAELAKALDGLDLADAGVVDKTVERLASAGAELAAERAEKRARLALVQPTLKAAARRAAALRKLALRLGRRRPPRKLSAAQRARLEQAEQTTTRQTLLRAEIADLDARARLVAAKRAYLERTQPARRAAAARLEAQRQRAVAERQAAEQDQKKALATEANAEQARAAALLAQSRARSETERALAGERARLEAVRGEQARLDARLARGRAELARLRLKLERLRGEIDAKVEALKKGWPKTATQHDPLYDRVVKQLVEIRPLAVAELTLAIKGVPDPPRPGDLAARVARVTDAAYAAQRERLGKLRDRLAAAADKLEQQQRALVDERLELLSREAGTLNQRRTELLRRVTPAKRRSLIGLSRATAEQLGREIVQLTIDALYWVLRRWRQIDEVPRMIRDIFTVGSTLWTLIKLIALIFLLRFVLRRWEGWGDAMVRRVGRTLTLGRHAPLAAKLADGLHHAGPSLLVLIAASLAYHLLGGPDGAVEIQYVYEVFFWVAVYRVHLRLVETGAKYTGMQQALRAAEGDEEILEHEPNLEGPPVPRAVRLAQQVAETQSKQPKQTKQHKAIQRVELASVLLVRSVRAATRYILIVVLVLKLTALAVGEGTIYGLTAGFSWWAALPFVFFFLRLWRPHIVTTYQQQVRGQPQPGALARAVERSEEKVYGIFVIAAAFGVVFGNRVLAFARRYLFSLDATKRLLAFFFRRQVAKHAEERGRVLKQRQELPQVLLDQFPDGALTRAQAPVRPPVLDELIALYRGWEQDHADGSVALVGRAGMGRSTILRALDDELRVPVLRGEPRTKITRPAKLVGWIAEVFGFSPKPSSERDLIRKIREDRRPMIVLDDCHNLFLRQVGGFEAWECFVRVVNETCDNVFWLLSFNQAAWDYLHNFGGRVAYFRELIELKPWTEKQIRSLLLGRTYRAGFRVSFSDLVVAELQDVSRSAQLGRTSEGYFRLLWDFTDGNPRLAAHFWLDSLVLDDDGRNLRVNLYAEPPIAKLDKLPPDVGFVLTAVATHQNLTAEEAARTTNLSVDFCRFAFSRSLESGYLSLDHESGRAHISRRWQRSLMRYLRRKHLLHE